MTHWISVADRLPEPGPGDRDSACVLVVTESKRLVVAYCQHYPDDEFESLWIAGCCGIYSLREVTHWIPLPEPPTS